MLSSLFQSSSLPVLEQVVNFTEARHGVLAGNIANLDTPGYKTRDLSPETFQQQLKEAIEGMSVLFPKGLSTLLPAQQVTLNRALDAVKEFNEILRARDMRAEIEVIGHTDSDGSDSLNGPLSQARAEVVRAALGRLTLDAVDITPRGVGSTAPMMPGNTEPEKERNRRASFRVVLHGDTSAERGRP